jgi:hypothetical protein
VSSVLSREKTKVWEAVLRNLHHPLAALNILELQKRKNNPNLLLRETNRMSMYKRPTTLSGSLPQKRPKTSSKSASGLVASTWTTSKEAVADRITWGRVCRYRILFLTLAEKIRMNRQNRIRWREIKRIRP